jgi:predicted metal-dependent phosphoesterase TrpH
MFKVDLHTHSVASPDGGLTPAHYRRMLESGGLDYVAVTDHNTIALAVELHAQLGDRIIIGEEITTAEGEIIGLFLREEIPAGRSLAESAALIKQQGGVVYVPHPFETVRNGVHKAALDAIAAQADIIEAKNGRAVFQNKAAEADAWARVHAKPTVASSDAHGWAGWGNTYSEINRAPAPDTLAGLLRAAHFTFRPAGLRAILYPKFNRLRKGVRGA